MQFLIIFQTSGFEYTRVIKRRTNKILLLLLHALFNRVLSLANKNYLKFDLLFLSVKRYSICDLSKFFFSDLGDDNNTKHSGEFTFSFLVTIILAIIFYV